MTTCVCRSGMGRTEFATVLVEIEAVEGLKEEIELQYRDKNQNVKGIKKVKVDNDWKPPVCNHCNVFGHSFDKCSKRVKNVEEIAKENEERTKQVEEREFNVVQNRFKRPMRITENNRNYTGAVNGNVQKVDISRNKVWKQKQQDVRNNGVPGRDK
ncbi:hypothetical protein Tco_0388452, partial [Tanacetum coccineum]